MNSFTLSCHLICWVFNDISAVPLLLALCQSSSRLLVCTCLRPRLQRGASCQVLSGVSHSLCPVQTLKPPLWLRVTQRLSSWFFVSSLFSFLTFSVFLYFQFGIPAWVTCTCVCVCVCVHASVCMCANAFCHIVASSLVFSPSYHISSLSVSICLPSSMSLIDSIAH